jgi:hypothetical protein
MHALVILLAGGPAVAGAETLLRVDGTGADLRGLPMRLDGGYVGVVGDAVRLHSASHRLSVELPSGLVANYEIVTRAGHIDMTSLLESSCIRSSSWLVGDSSALTVQQDANGASVKLPTPGVKFEGVCPVQLPNLGCFWHKVDLRIHSVPEVGAEIWVDGVQLKEATSEVLSLGYCGGTNPHVEFVLRKPGYNTCQASVRIDDEGGPYDVGCALTVATQWHSTPAPTAAALPGPRETALRSSR